jgi:hypothetical protein
VPLAAKPSLEWALRASKASRSTGAVVTSARVAPRGARNGIRTPGAAGRAPSSPERRHAPRRPVRAGASAPAPRGPDDERRRVPRRPLRPYLAAAPRRKAVFARARRHARQRSPRSRSSTRFQSASRRGASSRPVDGRASTAPRPRRAFRAVLLVGAPPQLKSGAHSDGQNRSCARISAFSRRERAGSRDASSKLTDGGGPRARRGDAAGGRRAEGRRMPMTARVGIGFDAHPFAAGGRCASAASRVPHARGSRGTRTATRSCTRSPTRSSGPPGSGPSATLPAVATRVEGAGQRDLPRKARELAAGAGWSVANATASSSRRRQRSRPQFGDPRRVASILRVPEARSASGARAATGSASPAGGRTRRDGGRAAARGVLG